MTKTKVGKAVPDFEIAATGGRQISLKSLRGKTVVLYFYPKDSTPGCTTEGLDFAANHATFKKANTVILGISRDSVASHEKFKAKQDFPFDLLSDANEVACGIFDVIKEKNMYGKKYWGIERSTFVIDQDANLKAIFRKVKVDGHVDEVLKALRA